MARVAPRIPELTDLLCEHCGYVLNGLPEDGRCPECGTPISDSVGAQRTPPAWESSPNVTNGFSSTTAEIICRPTRFYRTFPVRGSLDSARRFGVVHWWIASTLFGITAGVHNAWYWTLGTSAGPIVTNPKLLIAFLVACVILTVACYFALDGITRLAARLTNWEASYRGIRLPYDIVLRGMYYHAAHYLPVALAALATVVGYQIILATNKLNMASTASYTTYLYVLSGQVVLSAVYLFNTYWIGMRNMMYANR